MGSLTIHDGATLGDCATIQFAYRGSGLSGSDCGAGELYIADDLTITGDGGHISGAPNGNGGSGACQEGENPGKIISIENVGVPAILTIVDGEAAGELDITGQIEISAKLVNNAHVGSSDSVLSLTTNPKSGSGEWFANGGTLAVESEVSGSASWSADHEGKIHIKTECGTLSGDIVIYDGAILEIDEAFTTSGDLTLSDGAKLDVDDDFCTTGDLDFAHLETKDACTIEVAPGKSASFGGSCS